MRFAFTAEEEAFREEVRDYLRQEWTEELPAYEGGSEESWGIEQEMRKKLADKGWLTLSWPEKYGGLEASTMQQVIFNDEWSYAQAPGRDGLGIGFIGPCHHGTRYRRAEATAHWRHSQGRSGLVPGILGAGVGVRPGLSSDQGRRGWRPLRDQRSEDMDQPGTQGRLDTGPRSYRPGGAQAQGDHHVPGGHEDARSLSAAYHRHDGPSPVQRDLLR